MLDRARILDNDGKGARLPSFIRYAIYYTPRPGTALAAFGRSWFGRANDGATLQAFSERGLTGAGFARLPMASGRYGGLHATFKAPFALREDIGPDGLRARLASFTDRRKPLQTGPLTLARAGRFLVLRPVKPTPTLDWLAAQCVSAFDDFAAPIGESERRERQGQCLSDYQRLLLESFGDPHVLSEYRFSIILAGPLDGAHLERVTQALWPVLDEICTVGVTIDALSLFGDPGGRSAMRLISRHRFGA